MTANPPQLIAIDHDDYHAEHVGRTADGRQFFLTAPFEPGVEEFLALFLFDGEGQLLEALIDRFGPRATMDRDAVKRVRAERLASLGRVTHTRIEVAPFSVERYGVEFGLLVREIEDEDEEEPEVTVELHPGNYMAFWEPWDSGEYDT